MTIAEQIVDAVRRIVSVNDLTIFTRDDTRISANVSREIWDASYSPILQGMRSDHPGGAPNVGKQYKNVFRRTAHGEYVLTSYGRELIIR